MKKATGIISLIGCCAGAVFCFFLMLKTTYLDIKELEELITAKEYELRVKEQELKYKEDELKITHDEKSRIWKLMVAESKKTPRGYVSERWERLSEELIPIEKKGWDLERDISDIKGQQYEDAFGLSWYAEDSIKGIQEAIERAQMIINGTRERMSLMILIDSLVISILALGIHYVIATRFGSIAPTVLQHLEKENNFIRKQIEKRELLVKLENIEKE